MHAPTPIPLVNDGALAPGTRLGRYELVRRLAVGGMAELYLARQPGIGGFQKLVALKRILPQYAQSRDFVGMFLDEARLAATIQHANVAQVYDLGRTEHGLYFTMEYVHGEDVRAIANAGIKRDGDVPLHIAIAIAIGAAAGLHAAHELVDEHGTLVGLVHRDVSPSNVLVSYGGCVKLIDFGVAKAAGRQQETRAGTLKGKIAYMSPEQCKGAPIDRRSDVFALGVVLYEMATGTRLFTMPTDGGDYALIKRIVEEDAPLPSSRRDDFPLELEGIIMRALRRDPDERYPSAQALQLDLERFARKHGMATSMTEIGAYVRGLFPGRVGEPATAGVAKVVRMATGTPHVPTAGMHPRFQTETDEEQSDDEPEVEVVTHTSMFEATPPPRTRPGTAMHTHRKLAVVVACTAVLAAAIAAIAVIALRPSPEAAARSVRPERATTVRPERRSEGPESKGAAPVTIMIPAPITPAIVAPAPKPTRAKPHSVAHKPHARAWDPDSALPPP
ncbi:MAG TPA: protein kinase [Kofleriaceae bacterium]|nr:protein kinase [Kofleriaceae bacterium]